ncbi:hypothetical protein [Cedecea sp. NFIX57]|uniref:hypothetical protein n=1 Tax=Cedecea sp. NFIX57 TaxID=1566286 RepID=UPI000A0A74EA|nr:hypothetical protein [Cedecea sp. NFIX57]SMG60178.1 hypothetical protein SAMN03159353_103424 [Cedecea sp. NFIX57]
MMNNLSIEDIKDQIRILEETAVPGESDAFALRALRELLALREAGPITHPVNDDMALAFCHAISDSSVGSDELEDVKTGLRAALANYAAPQLRAVPPGWVMVPVEPTDEMTEAMYRHHITPRNALKAAIAAAPKPEVK